MEQELKKHTRRYHRTDKKFLRVAYRSLALSDGARVTIKEIAHQAGVNISTFYRHFRSLLDFSQRHRRLVKQASEQLLIELVAKNPSPEVLFFKINRLIYLNRASVRFLLASKDDQVIRQIFWILRPLITANWSSYGRISDQKIYCFFVAEATEAVRLWVVGHNFCRSYIDTVTRQLAAISRTAPRSLAPIVKAEGWDEKLLPEDYI